MSLTSVASKILEHIIVSQIMEHLDNQNILNENQHGFRAKRSCESQLLMTTNDITKWMNNNIQVDIAILDFAIKLLIKDYQRNSNTMALMEPPEYGLMHSSVKGSKE